MIAFTFVAMAPARAQEDPAKYPARPIHIVVGFAAGGGNDIIARVFGQKLSESLGQPVVIENRPGAGAIVAMEHVARSAPDGYTLLVSASGIAVNPAVYAKLPYDAVRDFVAVSEIAAFPLILIVNAASPFKTSAELVAYAKANPDKTNYASSSATFQLVTELFKQKTGAPMQVIPYKSATEFGHRRHRGPGDHHHRGCRSGIEPDPGRKTARTGDCLPETHAGIAGRADAQEQGADVDGDLWTGVFAPKATPPAIVRKLESEFIRISQLPDVVARLKPLGVRTVGNSSEEFAKIVAADIVRWGEVAKAANIKIEQ